MKVRYIAEGYFKKPEQAKDSRKKEKELSNADKVAATADKVLRQPIVNYLNMLFNTGIRDWNNSVNYLSSAWIKEIRSSIFPSYYDTGDIFQLFPSYISADVLKPLETTDQSQGVHKYVRMKTRKIKYEKVEVDLDLDTHQLYFKFYIKNLEPENTVLFAYLDTLAQNNFAKKGKHIGSIVYRNVIRSYIDHFIFNSTVSSNNDKAIYSKFTPPQGMLDFYYKWMTSDRPSPSVINVQVVFELNKDLLLAPISRKILNDYLSSWTIIPKNQFDVVERHLFRDNSEQRRAKIDSEIYPITTIKEIASNKFEKVPMHALEWKDYDNMFKSSYYEPPYGSVEEIAATIKKSFVEDYNISISGPGHIYLSTGYFEKNYLIL